MAPGIIGISNLERLENMKKDIRCLLISRGSRDITLNQLNNLYKDITDTTIPFKDFNFTSLKEFLSSIPDVVQLKFNNKNELCVYHIDTEKSKHISSLVYKEKVRLNPCKTKSVLHKNSIHPCLLNTILQELITVNTHKNNGISKDNVLTEITNRIGKYAFYTKQNLNKQLNELTHLLIHDDNYIYPKKDFFKISKSEFDEPTLQKNFIFQQNEIENLESINKKMLQTLSLSDLIKENTKNRLQKLIEKHPEGIWCSELPKIYLREYGLDLEYSNLGFNSIIEFVAVLPNIFQVVKPLNAKKLMLLDARISVDELSRFKLRTDFVQQFSNVSSDSNPIPKNLSPKVCKSLIPRFVMNLDDTVDQISVSSLFTNDTENYIDVVVSEVHNPSFFWITLYKHKKLINKLMSQLQEFYIQQDLDKYTIPHILLQPGLHIACLYKESWHRGIIKKIKPTGVLVLFYDYGTIKTYDPKEVFFLDKGFSGFPAQAIPCGLSGIKPCGTNKWVDKINTIFAESVLEGSFVASIFDIDIEENSMMINLIDTHNEVNEIYIDEWMVKEKLAERGSIFYKKDNITFKHHTHLQKKEKHLSVTEISNEEMEMEQEICDITSEVYDCIFSPIYYVSTEKKLEALKKYKAGLSSSSQLSSPSVFSNNYFTSDDENKSFEDMYKINEQILNKRKIDFSSSNEYQQSENSVEIHSNKYVSTDDSNNSDSIDSDENNISTVMFKYCNELPIRKTNSCNTFSKNQNISKSFSTINVVEELNSLIASIHMH